MQFIKIYYHKEHATIWIAAGEKYKTYSWLDITVNESEHSDSVCSGIRPVLTCVTVWEAHWACEFIKINIIIFWANCFFLQHTYSSVSLCSSYDFHYRSSFAFFFANLRFSFRFAASQSVIYWNGKRCTLHTQRYEQQANERIETNRKHAATKEFSQAL